MADFEILLFAILLERDSRKDEAVVFIFIFATGGLLGWAALRPWIEKWLEVRMHQILGCVAFGLCADTFWFMTGCKRAEIVYTCF